MTDALHLRTTVAHLRNTVLLVVAADSRPADAAQFLAAALQEGHCVCVAPFEPPSGALAQLIATCETFLPKHRFWVVQEDGSGWDRLPDGHSVVVIARPLADAGTVVPAVARTGLAA